MYRYFQGGGVGGGVGVVSCVTVDRLRDKVLCTSPPMTLRISFCSHLLERWKAAMHHIVVLVNTEILFYNLSLPIAFSMFSLRNNPRQIIHSYPKSKTAKISVCCIAQVTWIHLSTHKPLMTM